jgi:hypothetical protein
MRAVHVNPRALMRMLSAALSRAIRHRRPALAHGSAATSGVASFRWGRAADTLDPLSLHSQLARVPLRAATRVCERPHRTDLPPLSD